MSVYMIEFQRANAGWKIWLIQPAVYSKKSEAVQALQGCKPCPGPWRFRLVKYNIASVVAIKE